MRNGFDAPPEVLLKRFLDIDLRPAVSSDRHDCGRRQSESPGKELSTIELLGEQAGVVSCSSSTSVFVLTYPPYSSRPFIIEEDIPVAYPALKWANIKLHSGGLMKEQ